MPNMPNMRNDRTRRLLAALVAVGIGSALLAWIATAVYRPGIAGSGLTRSAGRSPQAGGGRSAGPDGSPGRTPADVRVALLADFYEHGIEHAPPRDPSGCMQRRERGYAAPRDPVRLVAESSTASAADVRVRDWLKAWEQGWKRGDPTDPGRLDRLPSLLRDSSLSAECLLDVGRSMGFLDGDRHAVQWFRAGLAKAMVAYKGKAPGDPGCRPLLGLLDQTKGLWRARDYPALEQRFALAARLNPPSNRESRRAYCLYAEALYNQGRCADAADATVDVQHEHERAGDLGALDPSDVGEMDWVLGLLLFYANRYDQAIPYLRRQAEPKMQHREDAIPLLALALIRTDRVDDAVPVYRRVLAEVPRLPLLASIGVELRTRAGSASTGTGGS